jgi:hypothetical protein
MGRERGREWLRREKQRIFGDGKKVRTKIWEEKHWDQWRERRGKWREIGVECICFLVGRLVIYINLYAKMREYNKTCCKLM